VPAAGRAAQRMVRGIDRREPEAGRWGVAVVRREHEPAAVREDAVDLAERAQPIGVLEAIDAVEGEHHETELAVAERAQVASVVNLEARVGEPTAA